MTESQESASTQQQIDPVQALSRIRQADADWVITNQVNTPFNHYNKSVIQVLQIPPKVVPYNESGWIIVVYEYKQIIQLKQVVQPLVTDNQHQQQVNLLNHNHQSLKSSCYLKCKACHKDLIPNAVKLTKSEEKCSNTNGCKLTLDYSVQGAHYHCENEQHVNKVCALCYAQNFMKQSQILKTNQHATFIQGHTKVDLEHKITNVNQITQQQNDCYLLVEILKPQIEFSVNSNSSNNIKKEQGDLNKKSKQQDLHYYCHYSFQIRGAQMLKQTQNKFESSEIVFLSADEQKIFFFSRKDDMSQFEMHLYDITQLTSKVPFDNYNSQCYKIPQIHQKSFLLLFESQNSQIPLIQNEMLYFCTSNQIKNDKQQTNYQFNFFIYNYTKQFQLINQFTDDSLIVYVKTKQYKKMMILIYKSKLYHIQLEQFQTNSFKLETLQSFICHESLINVLQKGYPLLCISNINENQEKISVMTDTIIYTFYKDLPKDLNQGQQEIKISQQNDLNVLNTTLFQEKCTILTYRPCGPQIQKSQNTLVTDSEIDSCFVLKEMKQIQQNTQQYGVEYSILLEDRNCKFEDSMKEWPTIKLKFYLSSNFYFKEKYCKVNGYYDGQKFFLHCFSQDKITGKIRFELATVQLEYYNQEQLNQADPSSALNETQINQLQISFKNQNKQKANKQNSKLPQISQFINFWTPPKQSIQITYPILAYSQTQNTQNFITVCNLQKNIPQVQFQIDEQFVCFVEDATEYRNMEINNFYLARSKDQLSLYSVSSQPWYRLQTDDNQIKKVNLNINLRQLGAEQIIKAVYFNFQQKNHNQPFEQLFVQTDYKIIQCKQFKGNQTYFNFRDLIIPKSQSDDIIMVPIKMVTGLNQNLYFVRQNNRMYEVIQLFFVHSLGKFSEQVMLHSKEKILAIQLDYDYLSNYKNSHEKLLVLIEPNLIKIIQVSNEELKNNNTINHQISTIEVSDLCQEQVFKQLQSQTWPDVILSKLAILMCIDTQDQKFQKLFLYSTDSDQKKNINLGLDRKSNYNIDLTQKIQCSNKVVSIVREQANSYFVTSQSHTSKQIDFLNNRQAKNLQANIFVLSNAILVHLNYPQSKAITSIFQITSANPFLQQFSDNQQESCETQNKLIIYDRAKMIIQNIQTANQVSIESADALAEIVCIDGKLYLITENFQLLECNQYNTTINKMFKYCYYNQSKYILIIQASNLQDLCENEQFSDTDILKHKLTYTFKRQLSDAAVKIGHNDYILEIDVSKIKNLPQIEIVKFIATQNYFVLLTNIKNQIWFFKRPDIKQITFNLPQTVLFKKINPELMFENVLNKWEKDNKNQKYINITNISVNNLLQLPLNQKKHKFILKLFKLEVAVEMQNNAIQINMKDAAIIWDLDLNQEIKTVYNVSQINKPDTYIQTGFQYEDYFDGQARPMYQSRDQTLISYPRLNQLPSVCFRTFNNLEIQQLLKVEKSLESGSDQLQSKNISPSMYVANIYGDTFFSLFYQHDMQQNVFEQVYAHVKQLKKEMKLQKFQIYMKHLFYNLMLPFQFKPDHTIINLELDKEHEENMENNKSSTSFFKKLTQHKKQPKEKFKKKNLNKNTIKIEKVEQKISIVKQIHLTRINIDQSPKDKYTQQQNIIQALFQKSLPEKLVQLAMLSGELSLDILIQNMQNFKHVMDNLGETMEDFLKNSFIQTPMTEKVTLLKCKGDSERIIFADNTAQLNDLYITKRFQDHVAGSKDIHLKPVKVKILEISWLHENINKFYKDISGRPANVFEIESILVLLHKQNYNEQLIYRVMLPYFCYMGLCLYYFLIVIPDGYSENYTSSIITGTLIIIITLYQVFIELSQLWFENYIYFKDIWNVLMLGLSLLNLSIVITHFSLGSSASIQSQKHLSEAASIAVMTLWLYSLYWLRIFPDTAFFIQLLIQTIIDIGPFMYVFIIMICMFSSQSYIIDRFYIRVNEYENYQTISTNFVKSNLISSWFTQYLLSIGEFQPDNFEGNQSNGIVWAIFILATFFSNIVALNMLIAIMGATFDRVTEKKETNALIQRTQVYAEFIQWLKHDEEISKKKYLYIAQPVEKVDSQQQVPQILEYLSNLKQLFTQNSQELKSYIKDTQGASSLYYGHDHSNSKSTIQNLSKIDKEIQILKQELSQLKQNQYNQSQEQLKQLELMYINNNEQFESFEFKIRQLRTYIFKEIEEKFNEQTTNLERQFKFRFEALINELTECYNKNLKIALDQAKIVNQTNKE